MDSSHLTRLKEEQERALDETNDKISQWDKFKADYVALQQRLRTLPDRLTHEVMVPFGSLAFMPGQLVHTNEILVLLGDNWFVDRTAKQAAEIVGRRIQGVEAQLSHLHEQKKLLEPRLSFTSELQDLEQEKGGVIEIKEEYDPEKEKAWRVKHRESVRRSHQQSKAKGTESTRTPNESTTSVMSDEALWARLDELERREKEGREMERLTGDKEQYTDEGITSLYPGFSEESHWADRTVQSQSHDRPSSGRVRQKEEKTRGEESQVHWADRTVQSQPYDRCNSEDIRQKEGETREEECDSSSELDSDDYVDEEDETETGISRCKKITFTHTHSQDHQVTHTDEQTVTAESTEKPPEKTINIQSPADIYTYVQVNRQPKSILKKELSETCDRTAESRTSDSVKKNKHKQGRTSVSAGLDRKQVSFSDMGQGDADRGQLGGQPEKSPVSPAAAEVQAFSQKVVEKEPSEMSVIKVEEPVTDQPRKMSKFRAQRQKQGPR